MLSKTLQILANDLGLRVEENSACGIYEGYMISLYEAKGCKSVFFNCPFADPEDDALSNFDISESIKAKVETYAISDYGITGMGVYMTTRAPLADFKTMIDWAAQLLKENGIPGAEVCSSCGEPISGKKLKKVTDGTLHYVCCESCALDMLERKPEAENENQPANKPGLSVLTAIIGGLLGAAVFIGAYFLLPGAGEERAFDGQYIIAILGFLTAFLVYFGYRLFSKKKTAASVVLICLITLIFVLASQIFASMIDFYRTTDRALFSNFGLVFPMHFAVADYFKPMILYSVIDLMFAAVCLIIFLFDVFTPKKALQPKNYTVSQYIK